MRALRHSLGVVLAVMLLAPAGAAAAPSLVPLGSFDAPAASTPSAGCACARRAPRPAG